MLKEKILAPGIQPPMTNDQQLATTLDTQPKYFLATARKFGANKVAMRKKHLGIWREYTWADSLERVKNFSLGLVALGLERGNHVVIIGDNDPQWYWASLAVQSAGGTAVGAFIDCAPPEVEYIATNCDAVIAIAKDQEQVDKFFEIRARVPQIRKVIYWDDLGMWGYRDHDAWLARFEDVENLGRELDAQKPTLFEERVAAGKGDDIAIMCYTSGTTGNPKGAMIRHSNLIQSYFSYDDLDQRRPSDEHLSITPMAWMTENAFGVAAHCIVGNPVNFPESVETALENLREIAPHNVIYASRFWENIVSMVQAKMMDSGWVKRALYKIFLPIGYRIADTRINRDGKNSRLGAVWLPLYALGNALVFAPLRDKLGLARIRTALTVGAVLSPDVIRFFHAIGVNLKQLYGSTEMIFATIHRNGDIRFESVGKPVPSMDVRIGENNEIQVKGPSVFAGYYKNPEATAKSLRDGWYYSGDAGYLDPDGHLIYLDRVSDMLELAGGKKYSPQYIEGRLKFSPYIKDALALGGKDKPFVAAVINIDFENVGRWAEAKHIAYTTFADLSQKPQVYDMIQRDVERLNRSMPEAARIRRYVLLHKEFDPDEAEMTRTRKLRRAFVEKKYADLIDAIYGGKDEFVTEAAIKYRDGRVGTINTAIAIRSLG